MILSRDRKVEHFPYYDAESCESVEFHENGSVKRIVYRKKEAHVSEVIKIGVGEKYVVMVDSPLPRTEAKKLEDRLDEWMKGDESFIVLNANALKLVKI